MKLVFLTPVPAPPATLWGRERELDEITALAGSRALVTLWGPPGVGKTTLACAAIRRLSGRSVAYVDVAPATSLAGLLELVALALEVELPSAGERAVATLARSLGQHGRLLLIIDNAEAQIAGVRTLVSSCLAAAPGLQFLVASRHRVAIREETAVEIAPLAVPGEWNEATSPDEALASAALRMLAAQLPEAALASGDNLFYLTRICRRLDGLPLALEMAASQLRVTSPARLWEELEKSHDPLAAGVHNPNSRQERWDATMDWSWSLLSGEEQRALAMVSVLAGSFTADQAAELVAADPASQPARTAGLLGALRDKALLLQDAAGRLRLLQLVREYAAARRQELGLQEIARLRHAEQMARSASGCDLVLLLSKHRPDLGPLAAIAGDLRAALSFVESSPSSAPAAVHADLLVALSPIVLVTGPFAACCEQLERVVGAAELDDTRRAHLYLLLGLMRLRLAQADRAAVALDAALARASALSDALAAAAMLLRAEAGDYLNHPDLLERTRAALEVATRSGRAEVESYAHLALAQRCLAAGHTSEARRHITHMNRCASPIWAAWQVWGTTILSFEEEGPLVHRDRIERTLDSAHGRDRGFLLTGRAAYEARAGQLDRAEETLRESMTWAAKAGDDKLEWSTLGHAGLLDLRAGAAGRAASRLGHVLSLGRPVPHEVCVFDQALRAARIIHREEDALPEIPVPVDQGAGRAAAARLHALLARLVQDVRRTARGDLVAVIAEVGEEVSAIVRALDCEPHRFEARLALDTVRAWILRGPVASGRADLADAMGADLAVPLAIARDGSRIWRHGRDGGGQRLLHLLLGAMLRAHLEGETTVSFQMLHRAGWSQPLSRAPELHRLRVAMSKLRKLDIPVEHDDDGYRLVFPEPPLVV